MSWTEALERTVLAAELLSSVLPQVNIQISFEAENHRRYQLTNSNLNVDFVLSHVQLYIFFF